MHILWFVSGLKQKEGQLTSTIASVRLRALLPITGLLSMGIKVTLVALPNQAVLTPQLLQGVDIAVFGKVFEPFEALYQDLCAHNIPIVMDVCDNYFEIEHLKKNYEILERYQSAIVTATISMAERIQTHIHQPVSVVPDTFEDPCLKPVIKNLKSLKALKIVWFGQKNNLPHLLLALEEFSALFSPDNIKNETIHKITLYILTVEDPSVTGWVTTVKALHPNIEIHFEPWSQAHQLKIISQSDIVIIPSTFAQVNQVKTANRLMTAILCGKPTVAFPLPSYDEFADFCQLSTSMWEGIKALLSEDPTILTQRIELGQTYIQTHYSLKAIAQQWHDTLNTVMGSNPIKIRNDP